MKAATISRKQSLHLAAILFGNAFEHYDNALYGFLAPFFAAKFFPQQDPLTQMILAYALMPLTVLSRPVGALFFGYIGEKYGKKKALTASILGMAIATVWMGILPAYASLGLLAPVLLALTRMAQGFFAAGEYTTGIVYTLEQFPSFPKSRLSSLFQAFAIAGIVCASLAGAMVAYGQGDTWRVPFLFGGFAALAAYFLRMQSMLSLSSSPSFEPPFLHKVVSVLSEERKAMLPLAIVAGFNYANYTIPFILMNSLVPFVSSLTKEQLFSWNPLFLILDFCLFLLIGQKSKMVRPHRILRNGAILCSLLALPLFSLFSNASWLTICLLRFLLIVFGAIISIAYYPWAQEQVQSKHRTMMLGFCYSIGTQLIGVPMTAISLWLYQKTGVPSLGACYWMLISLVTACVLQVFSRKNPVPRY